jgi:hypothetical protein
MREVSKTGLMDCCSPIASLLGDDWPKIILKSGLFDTIPPPVKKSFEQDEPKWVKINVSGESL